MLNSGGGILLFGCYAKYADVIAKGDTLTETDKGEYEQRVMSYMDVFEPKIQAQKIIQISYVPVLLNPYEHYETEGMMAYSG